ncbi:hypothetical protein HD596_001719 [Nonomuraea jabiensis]|uniref:Uncharacterized protein n=1 Tax=Nonomuraea jabiensis TaxID=882448 RepID=A0A7W9G0I9_9ACTN|nr:hypothetical protein [Nonomuraea jabiensis]
MTTAIRPADRGAGTFDSSVCKLVTWVRHARYYSPPSARTELGRAVMRQKAHSVRPPPTTSQIPAPNQGQSDPRHQTPANPQPHPFLLLLPAHIPQPGVHPLPRTPHLSGSPHRSRRRHRLLHPRLHMLDRRHQRNNSPRPPTHHTNRRRHTPLVHPIRMRRLPHHHRPKPRPHDPLPNHRRDTPLKPPHLPSQQPPSKDRRRQQRPEQHDRPPPRLLASPPGHRQTLSTPDPQDSDHLSCLYRSSEHP